MRLSNGILYAKLPNTRAGIVLDSGWLYVTIDVEGGVDISEKEPSYNFGVVLAGATVNTGLTAFEVTNSSGFNVDIYIRGTDMEGGIGWTLSDTATPEENILGFKAGIEGGDYNIVVRKTEPYNKLVNGLAPSVSQKWGLQLLTPTIISDGVQKQGTITLMGVAS